MAIELQVVQFWSEIILVISNQTRATRLFDFEITRMISDQIALHSVQLPLLINKDRSRQLITLCDVIVSWTPLYVYGPPQRDANHAPLTSNGEA